MKVALIGASGMIGSRVLKELVSRGHQVIAVVRDPSKVDAAPGVTAVKADVSDVAALAEALRGADALVSAYGPGPGNEQLVIPATKAILEAARRAELQRVILVGGAASLFVAPGVTLLDSGHLPEATGLSARPSSFPRV